MRYRLRMCKNRVRRIMFVPKREKVNRGWHNYVMNSTGRYRVYRS